MRIPALLDTGLFRKSDATASPLAMIYVGGIFAGASAEKISEGAFAVWNCACAHAACTAPDVLCSRIFSGQCGDTTCNGTDYRNADDDCGCDDGERVRNGWRICTRGRFYHDALRNRNFAVHLLAALLLIYLLNYIDTKILHG